MEPVSAWGKISSETDAFFEHLGIDKHFAKNNIDEKYPIGNKITSMAKIDGPTIFLDSDMMLLKPFSWHYELSGEFASKLADVDTFSRGGGQWSVIYDLFDKEMPPKEYKATTTGELMRPYFNAGFISVKDGRIFSESWAETARRIDEAKEIVNKRPWLDQIALPIAINLLDWKENVLSDKFNFPCHIEKVGELKPYFAHYHWPSVIEEDRILYNEFKNLLKKYPALEKILEKYDDWNDLLSKPIRNK